MRDYKVKTIRALDRGLAVLQALQALKAATLNDLYRDTGVPRATLLRILVTLEKRGLVWQRLADNAYLPGYRLQQRLQAFDDVNQLVGIASPILEELCDRVRWPSILGVRRLFHMEVIETNRSRAYFDHIPLGPVGFRVSMLRSATGRAYLAFCEPEEREEILAGLRDSPHPGDMKANDGAWVQAVVLKTRRRGFGLRDPDFGGHYDKPRREFDDGRNSIAVPISVAGHGVAGCLNLTWIRRVATTRAIVDEHLGALRDAAAAIATRLAASG